MAEPTTTTRRPARCSKDAFAPRASWRPKNDIARRVALRAHRHQSCLGRTRLASETAGAGDDPVNNSDPTGQFANICHGLLWIGWAASPLLCAIGGAVQTLPGPTLYRFGQAYEDASALQADAERAEAAGFPFGVSVFDRKPSSRTDYSTARTAEVEEHFHIAKTGSNPHHYTIVLPNPVTGEVARTFNRLFGRTPPAELSAEFLAGCTSGFVLSNTTNISNDLL